jgi:hypothetical protein
MVNKDISAIPWSDQEYTVWIESTVVYLLLTLRELYISTDTEDKAPW